MPAPWPEILAINSETFTECGLPVLASHRAAGELERCAGCCQERHRINSIPVVGIVVRPEADVDLEVQMWPG